MVGATIVTGGTAASSSSNANTTRRFLALDHSSKPSLITIVANHETTITGHVSLVAGARIRLVGVRQGHTIRAARIDVLN